MGQIAVDLTETIRGSGPLLPVTSSLQDTSTHSHASGHESEASGAVGTRSVSTALVSLPEQDAPSHLDPVRILKADLVGREEEIAPIQRAFNQACIGRRRV